MRRLIGTVLVLLCAAGCGIRDTPVPVDAGAAPTRVSCATPTTDPADPAKQVVATVYLECSSQLTAVDRVVPKLSPHRSKTAATLLLELKRRPSDTDAKAGFSTDVPKDLLLSGPDDGDPDDAMRLSTLPHDLPDFALGQIVCTLTGAEADDRPVVLGGPGDAPLESYLCTDDLRTRPDAARTAGTAVG